MSSTWQEEIAAGRAVVIDGGTGAELERRGVALDPTCWHALAGLTHHAELVAVHVDFINAGARVITTNTFATHRYVLAAAGDASTYSRLAHATVTAARRARMETGIPVEIAGSLSCMPPAFDVANYPRDNAARKSYVEQAHTLADLGVDLIALEMIQDARHGGWALDAAIATGLPVWLGIAARAHPQTAEPVCFDRAETSIDSLLCELLDRRPDVVNIMHTPVSAIDAAFDCVRARWNGPIGIYPEVGSFDAVKRTRSARLSPSAFAAAANGWLQRGAALIGGCCGATPSHIGALIDELQELRIPAAGNAETGS